jgi:hypothetical protein
MTCARPKKTCMIVAPVGHSKYIKYQYVYTIVQPRVIFLPDNAAAMRISHRNCHVGRTQHVGYFIGTVGPINFVIKYCTTQGRRDILVQLLNNTLLPPQQRRGVFR